MRLWFGLLALLVATGFALQFYLLFTGGSDANSGETGEGIPAWSFRIEGRLLEVSEGGRGWSRGRDGVGEQSDCCSPGIADHVTHSSYMLTTTSQPPNARTKDKAATTRKFSTFIKPNTPVLLGARPAIC